MYTRRNVWRLGSDWATEITWYARAVRALKAKPITDPTSWRFLAGIHGFHRTSWEQLGYLKPTDPLPAAAVRDRFWDQCQHSSWYFLPWHRGYLLAFEQIVRDQIVQLGGPKDWALPYWNYFGTTGTPDQARMPIAFTQPQWDGGPNPLYVPQRYGPGAVKIPLDRIDQGTALGKAKFLAAARGGDPGFGAGDQGDFRHGGGAFGQLESQPHNMIHVLIGGDRPGAVPPRGIMSVPSTAALDPIFWLHHANIDRLWETWNRSNPGHTDPLESEWRHGPTDRRFVMPQPQNLPDWVFTPVMLESISDLGYVYESLAPTVVEDVVEDVGEEAGEGLVDTMDGTDDELVGGSDEPVQLRADGASDARVRLDRVMRDKLRRHFDARPDRVFLTLENIRGNSSAAAFGVLVGAPGDAEFQLVTYVAPFGVEEASSDEGEHAGQGLTVTMEITEIVQELMAAGAGPDDLDVRFEPMETFVGDAELSVGQVTIHRQGT